MRTRPLKILLLMLLAILFFAPPCLAKAKGYFYVVAYSFQTKKVYCSSIFVQKVKDTSYSAEEFTTDVDLLQKIETAYKKHLATLVKRRVRRYTMVPRGAYKSYTIAKKRLDAEQKSYTNKGLTIINDTNFKFE